MSDTASLTQGCVAFNLRRASRIVTRRYEKALQPLGVKSFQFSTLAALAERENLPQSALAKAFGMDISTINRNLKPLETRGVVEIHTKPEDGRVKLVSITPAGRALLAKAIPLWRQAQEETLKDLSGPEWAELRTAIRNLA
ncbi:MAG: MarR family winged helix-turn-helix transcriptional regulator [Pseudomonadota bacterium]